MADLLGRYLAPSRPQNAADPLDRVLGEEQRRRANANLLRTGVDPDRAARANRLGRELGLPGELAESNLVPLEADLRTRRAAALLERYPRVRSWLADPRNAAASLDDLEAMAKTAEAFERRFGVLRAPPPRKATVANFFRGIWESLSAGAEQTRASGRQIMSDLGIGKAPWLLKSAPGANLRAIERAQARVQAATPAFKSSTMRGLYSGASSLAQLAPALAVSVATRNPAPVITVAGGQTGVQAYGKYRARGASPALAAIGGAGEGGVEAATELLPMGFAVQAFGKAGFGTFVAGLLGRDVPGEQVATFAQDAIDTAIANPDTTWREFLEQRPGAAYETLVATVTQALALGGPAMLARRFSDTQTREEAVADVEAASALVDAAAASKTRERDPEAFRQFIAQLGGEDAQNVYLPAETARELFQSDLSGAEFFGPFSEEIEEAAALGGDIVVPLADVAANLAGTPVWDRIKEEVRFSPGGMSAREAKTFDDALADEFAAMGEELSAAQEAELQAVAPRQKVVEAVRDALLRVGYAPDAALAQAELYGAHYATLAEAFGTDAFSEFERAGLRVEQRLPEKLGKIQAADGLDILIATMKRGATKGFKDLKLGRSLLEFLAERGGIEDIGGDLTAMGAHEWHRDKPFRKKLVRAARERGGTLIPMQGGNDNTPDALALAAWEAGYFPEFSDRPTVNDLFAAIDAELHGTPRFADLAESDLSEAEEIRQAAEELFELLDRDGLDVLTATREQVEQAIAEFQNEAASGRSYGQDKGTRGRIAFNDGGAVIELFENRDLSTFIHETGHLWLEELWRNAERPDAPSWMKDAKKTVRGWFKANGHPVRGSTIPTEAHELWARTFERYTMEGKAPSASLRRAFERFRVWLTSIYRAAIKARAPIAPEIWDVMERLLATEVEIEEARADQALSALFESAAEARMSESEFQAYRATAEDARNDAYDALLQKTMRVIRQSRMVDWKAEEAEVREQVAREVDQQREFRVLATLKAKEPRVRLSSEWLREVYGEAVFEQLPQSVPPIHSSKSPVSAEAVAEMHGFSSADEMVRTLMGMEQQRRALREAGDKRSVRQVYIDQGTEEIMRQRHGDPLADGSIEEEAIAAVHSDKQGELISAELRTLGRRMGQKPTPWKLAREWAARKIAESRFSEAATGAAVQQYQRAARKAGREAEKALIEGNLARVYNLKTVQLINSALVAEAKKARDAGETAVARLAKIARSPTMRGVDQDYLDQAHALLEAFDFRRRSQIEVRERENFWKFVEARADEGLEMNVPPRLLDTAKHYSQLTVDELRGLDETVKQLVHLGRLKRRLLTDKAQRDLDDIANEIEAAVRASARPTITDLRTRNTPGSRWSNGAKRFLADHRKAASLARQMDGIDAGPLWQHLIRPMNDAADNEARMRAEATQKLKVLVQPLLKSGKMGGKGQFFPHLGISLNREERIGIALNMGNAGNRQRLLDGEGWSEEALRPILDSLTKEELDFVQSIWDFFESYRPLIGAKEKRVYGVEPEWVEPEPFETRFGTYRGGYYPIKYDPRRSSRAEQHEEAEALKRMVRGAYTSATPRRSFAKSRVEEVKGRPLNYTLAGLWQGTNEVIHDLAWHEWLLDANKLLKHRTIDAAMRQSYGPEAISVFKKAFEDIAAGDVPAQNVFESAINHIRMGATVAGLGWNVKTALLQPFGLSQSIVRVGAPWVARGMVKWLKSPIDVVGEITAKSTFMQLRARTMQREINEIQNRVSGGKSALRELVEASFFVMIQKAQLVADVPTWSGAYEKAIDQGREETDAIALADQAVRDSQGGGQVSDLARIQRGGPLQKLFTNFYSYFNVTYNLSAEAVARTDFRKPGEVMRLAMDFLLLYSVPATFGFLLAEAFGAAGGDDDDRWVERLAAENLSYLMGTMIGVRELAGAAQSVAGVRQYEAAYGGPAGLRALQEFDKAGKQVGQREWDEAMRRSLVNAAGISFHLPSGQINRTWDGSEALASDESDNPAVLVTGAR
jgi:hypothetical protein